MLSLLGIATRSERLWQAVGRGCLLVFVFASGCFYDSDHRCDSTQRFDDAAGVCICREGSVPGAHGCISCGEHETAQGDNCVCVEGYAKPAEGGACALIPEALGAECDPTAPACDSRYPSCHATSNALGYCTTECTSSAECTGGFVCDTSGNPPYCQRPPVGVGQKCTSNADCASFEATYCESLQSHVCLVQGCTKTPNDCFPGNDCCDLTSVGLPTVCVPAGTCPFP
jgi:hypothetical protein